MTSNLRHSLRRLGRESHGVQIVEFALLVPVLLLIIMGTLEFGRAYFSWIILTNSAREGARTAALGFPPATVYGQVETAAGGLPRIDPPAYESCPPILDQAWCIETDNLQGTRGEATTVRVQYNFKFIVPVMLGVPSVIPLTAASTMRLE